MSLLQELACKIGEISCIGNVWFLNGTLFARTIEKENLSTKPYYSSNEFWNFLSEDLVFELVFEF